MWTLFEKVKRLSIKLAEAVIKEDFSAPELSQWARDSAEGTETIRHFRDPNIRQLLFNQFENPEKTLAVRQLKKKIQKKRKKILWMRAGIAATILLCLGSLLFLYKSSLNEEPELIAHITPGTQKAMLVLSNGEQMELSQITRLKEKDGTAITRSQKGEIKYHTDSVVVGKVDSNTLIIPRYGEYSVVLADGTRVMLNSESELRYPTAFTGPQREVRLKGEAYLEVSKSDRPFIIHTYNTQVKVYGTRLDINSYDPEKIKVVLAEGKVGVSCEKEEEVFLEPAQLAIVDRLNGITVTKGINPDYYIAWQNGYFAFNNERLEDILTVLARWYNFEVLYTRSELRNIHFTASLQKEQPLENILRQFEKTRSITFRIIENQIVVQ